MRGGWPCLSRAKHYVLEEVGQLLDVDPVVLAVELLKYRQEARYEVRPIYRELCLLILAHNAAELCVVAQVLVHAQGKDGEEARHALEPQRHCIDLVHWVEEAERLAADSQLPQHRVQLLLSQLLPLLTCELRRIVEHLVWNRGRGLV